MIEIKTIRCANCGMPTAYTLSVLPQTDNMYCGICIQSFARVVDLIVATTGKETNCEFKTLSDVYEQNIERHRLAMNVMKQKRALVAEFKLDKLIKRL